MVSAEPVPTHARRVATAVVVGLVGPLLDTTIVSIALDRLGSDLRADLDTVQWVGTAYFLALGIAIPLAGWAAARFGARAAWSAGLWIFLVGSILCTAAWNIPALIAFRVIQGAGGGLLFPLMTSILVKASGGRALGQLVSLVSLPTAFAPIIGPVAGGLILHYLDWRWMFAVNIPLVIVGLILARRIDDDRADGPVRSLDLVGLILLAPGLAGILLGLSAVHDGAARPGVVVPLCVGLILLALFVIRGFAAPPSAILMDVRVLRRRFVAASSLGLFFFGIAALSVMFVLPLFFQQLRGESVLGAAMVLIPQGVGTLLTRTAAGRLADSTGARRVAVAGFVITAAATVPFALATVSTPTLILMGALLLRGMGLGLLLSPVMAAAFVGLPMADRYDASTVSRCAQQLGASFGTAVLSVVLVASATMAGGFHAAFWCATVLALAGAAVSGLLPGKPG